MTRAMPFATASGAPLRLDEALAIIDGVAPVAAIETIALTEGRGRILARDITAPISLPPADNAAVDGYAFRHAPAADGAETACRLIGHAAAGHPFDGTVGPGEAIRILTGAPVPDGADTVAPEEVAHLTEDGTVVLPAAIRAGANRRRAGEDVANGSVALTAGTRLGPAEIGLLAALGCEHVDVRQSLSVAIFSTGDELAAPGTTLLPGRIHDANRPALMAMVEGSGHRARDLGIIRDEPAALRSALAAAAATHDLVIGSAGMSASETDHLRASVVACGGRLDFMHLAFKPGKAIAIGAVGDAAFLGLPGNPVAALVTMALIGRAYVARLAGGHAEKPPRIGVAADFAHRRRPGRREFMRATLHMGEDGRSMARRLPHDGSAILSSLIESDGLLDIAEDIEEIRPGDFLPFLPFADLGLR